MMKNDILSKHEYEKRRSEMIICSVIGFILILVSNTFILHTYGLKVFFITVISDLGTILLIIGCTMILLWTLIYRFCRNDEIKGENV